jgi:hypothetical protein
MLDGSWILLIDVHNFEIFWSKNVMKREARFDDEMEFGRIGGVLRDRSVCRVDQSFFG